MADGRLIRALMNCHGLKAPGGLLDLDLGQENEPVLEMGGWDSVPKMHLEKRVLVGVYQACPHSTLPLYSYCGEGTQG